MTQEVILLPFLNKNIRSGSGVIVKERQPDPDTGSDVDVSPDSIEDCVERLLSAISKKDKAAIVEAIRDIHDELHLEMSDKSNSYAEQNKAAAKDQE